MASSIIGGLIESGWPPQKIHVSEPLAQQRENLANRFGLVCYDDNSACVNSADVVILAVKPQVLHEAVSSISTALQSNLPLLISIVAGISSADTLRWVGADLPFIRVMPNTPALVNRGVSGLFANEFASKQQKHLSESIMQAVGQVVWVDEERLIDVVTGVSGSGPAYFFKTMELILAEGIANGLDPSAAKTLVIQTALGAATLAEQSSFAPDQLRKQVTSPGGTTEAGILSMEMAGIDKTIRDGVKAAITRSAQLAEQFGSI